MKFLWAVCASVLAVIALAGPLNAQSEPTTFTVTVTGHAGDITGAPSEHFLTFSGPVQVPGVGLAPGAYIFRFVSHDVVQVLSGDRENVYAMFQTVPVSRAEMSEDYTMTLQRTSDDAPPRIVEWFLPSALTGVALIYPTSSEEVTFVAMK